jgi:DNA-directed RNA polymerase specialized sigma24 family protein
MPTTKVQKKYSEQELQEIYERIVTVKAKKFYIHHMTNEEVKQELHLAILVGMKKFNPKRGANKKTFAERIAHNKAIDLYRKSLKEPRRL